MVFLYIFLVPFILHYSVIFSYENRENGLDDQNFEDSLFTLTRFNVLEKDYDHNQIRIYRFLETQKSSYIIFIKDDQDNHYIVKQEKNESLNKQFRALSEALCAHIAMTASIPSQRVQIIPVGKPFPGKFITKRVATLHSVVPGYTIRSFPEGPYGRLDIKQDAYVDTPVHRQGFNERTIFWMSQHPQLPLITALDTFIGNKDRNKANLLYDPDTDSFYVIDMALMYDVGSDRKSVAKIACDQVVAMLENKKTFTEKELEALRAYRSTLKKLIIAFPPHIICSLLDDLYAESGIAKTSLFKTKEIIALLNSYKKAIKQSHIDIKKLIYLLFILINR